MTEEVAALVEGIEAAGLPGGEEAGECHAGVTAPGAAGAAADLAGDDEGAQAPLGQIVVRMDAGGADELEELAVEAQQAVGQGVTGMGRVVGILQPELAGPLLVVRKEALALRASQWGAAGMAQDRLGTVVERPHRCAPGGDRGVVRIVLPELMQVAQQVHPAPLVSAVMRTVRGVEIAHDTAGVAFAQQARQHGTRAGSVAVEQAHAVPPRRAQGPDVAVATGFSPARLVGMHGWARPHLRQQLLPRGRGCLRQAVQDARDRSDAQMQAVQRLEVLLDRAHRQASHRSQVGQQRDESLPQTSLPHRDARRLPVDVRGAPARAVRTPPLEDLVLGHDDGRGARQVQDLPRPGDALAPQPVAAVGAVLKRVLHDLRRRLPTPSLVVLGCATLPRLWLFARCGGLHEAGRRLRRLQRGELRLQRRDALQRGGEGRGQPGLLGLQPDVLRPQACVFFFQRHSQSLPALPTPLLPV